MSHVISWMSELESTATNKPRHTERCQRANVRLWRHVVSRRATGNTARSANPEGTGLRRTPRVSQRGKSLSAGKRFTGGCFIQFHWSGEKKSRFCPRQTSETSADTNLAFGFLCMIRIIHGGLVWRREMVLEALLVHHTCFLAAELFSSRCLSDGGTSTSTPPLAGDVTLRAAHAV